MSAEPCEPLEPEEEDPATHGEPRIRPVPDPEEEPRRRRAPDEDAEDDARIERALRIIQGGLRLILTRPVEESVEDLYTPHGPSKQELAEKIRAFRRKHGQE